MVAVDTKQGGGAGYHLLRIGGGDATSGNGMKLHSPPPTNYEARGLSNREIDGRLLHTDQNNAARKRVLLLLEVMLLLVKGPGPILMRLPVILLASIVTLGVTILLAVPLSAVKGAKDLAIFLKFVSSAKQTKERASSVVITVIEGDASSREIEKEFNLAFGDSWRCTARTIGPNQYIMRFPTQVEVERAVYYGSSMKLKTIDATVRLSTWTASVGAKAVLQNAWLRISNIPLDKRVEENAFYAGSLVGISLDLDISTLHKPEYVRVLVGCRDVDLIPALAEGCLGDNFYEFFYEIDKVIVGGTPKDNTGVTVSTNVDAPSPKRPRME
ncbi:hypothetical protein ACQ4PT_044429 [Festuca glaucescens]